MTTKQIMQIPIIQLPFDNNHNMRWLYVTRISRDITNRATIFFFPIFLFVLGQSLSWPVDLPGWSKGILFVAIYHLIFRILTVIILLPLYKLTEHLSHTNAMVIGNGFRAIFYALLTLTVENPTWLLLVVIVEVVESGLFWPHFHTLLTKTAQKNHLGSDVGVLQFTIQVLAVLAPIVAIMFNNLTGYSAVFMIGIIGSLVGLITSLQLKSNIDRDKVFWIEFKEWIREPRYKRYLGAVGGRMLNDLVMYLWPLYLFILLGSIDRVGYLAAISFFIALFVTVIASFKLDKIRSAKIFHLTGGVLSLMWLARTTAISPWTIAIIDSIDKIVGNAHWLFFDMLWFKRAKGDQAFSFFVYHELISSAWLAVFWLIIAAILLLTQNWIAIFVLGAVGMLMTLLLQGKHGESAG